MVISVCVSAEKPVPAVPEDVISASEEAATAAPDVISDEESAISDMAPLPDEAISDPAVPLPALPQAVGLTRTDDSKANAIIFFILVLLPFN
jgi:hypothetical protein